MDPKRLANVLTAAGLVERFAIDQALSKLKPKEALADRLVSEGLLAENDLLRAMAQATKTRFVSSERLMDLNVARAALELIPRDFAEHHEVLPIAWDAGAKALSVAIVDPARARKLDTLPSLSRVEHLLVTVSLPSAIRLAIKRAYGRRDAPRAAPTPTSACPHCQTPCFDDQLECATCGLLLNPDARVDTSDARIVRALLSEPTGLHKIPSRREVLEGPTRRGFVREVSDAHVPQLTADVAIARTLSELEAFFVSFVDGQLSLAEVGQQCGLMEMEVRSVAASLAEREVLTLLSPAEAAALRPPLPPPPPPAPAFPLPPRVAPSARKLEPVAPKRPATPPRPPKPAPVEPPPKAPEPVRRGPLEAHVPRHLTPEGQVENSLQSALALERRGEIDGAIAVLKIAIARAPNAAALYNRLALVVLTQRKDARKAEELIHKALELEPGNAVYQQNLAKVLMAAATKKR